MATIRDVAEFAKVSTATVSRVINSNGYVNEETKWRVNEAIEQLNYFPNDVARSLFKGRSKMIALLVPDITNPFFPELARAIEDVTNQHGYTFVLCNTDNDIDKKMGYLSALQQKSVDGFIIVSSSLTEDYLKNIQTPIVALDRIISPEVSSVTVNNRDGARKAVKYLKSVGCSRIAHIAGPEHVDNAVYRMRGFLDEIKHEKWFDSSYVLSGAYNFEKAREAAVNLLTKNPKIDGIFAGNDLMGAGVLNAAASLDINVPEDLAVIGFDGISMSETVTPALTTMAQPIYDIGTKAAEILIEHISTRYQSVMREEFNVRLIERESTLRMEDLMSAKPKVCIIGSINMDLNVTTNKMPMQGETVLGDKFFTNPGGKGANQAVAAARMGADVNVIGAVGEDAFGQKLRQNLANEGIRTESIETIADVSTGTATIILSENDNRIIVAPGANNHVTPELVAKQRELIEESDIILMQLEVPMETIVSTVKIAEASDVQVILNPAPFQPLPESVLKKTAYMTPNEIELASMKEYPMYESIRQKMIVTRGGKGVTFVENGAENVIGGHCVQVTDTTGAGDTFNGALAGELAGGTNLPDAVTMANAAAALSVSKLGAQSGMPSKQDVQRFLQEGK
ncbi:hypothetical protein GCM10007063_07820 [Lentibacillus kapialis]|uniref:Ribokinase n=1 Tax=Lentibacillus kapialis TaxID=340214 RepID=A0A917UV98_9BACI|nr:ribokinase [Lentibacillus kapialis]GGJ87801.1 hypothetical protein GCM10007063_07820 [Lentibacillus kapialis]